MQKIRIIDEEGFNNSVFGAEQMLKYFPDLRTTGAPSMKIGKFYYLLNKANGKVANDSAFLSEDEMQFCEIVTGE